jgi:hypothetical protein
LVATIELTRAIDFEIELDLRERGIDADGRLITRS